MLRRFYFIITLLIIISLSRHANAQVKTTVFFEYGKYNLRLSEQSKLKKALYADTNDIVKIVLFGYTDSIGSVKGNLRLAANRAAAVEKYCREMRNESPIQFEIKPRGEKVKKVEDRDRKVDIVIYFSKPKPFIDSVNSKKMQNNSCYCRDCRINSYSTKRIDTIRGKLFMHLEVINMNMRTGLKYFTAMRDSLGIPHEVGVNWKSKRIEDGNWNYTVYFTNIPLKQYLDFGVFYKVNKPCDKCDSSLLSLRRENNIDSCWVEDYATRSVLKLKRRFLRRNSFIMRIPKASVDENLQISDVKGPVKYYERKGKKNAGYVFAKVKLGWDKVHKKTQFETLVVRRKVPCCTLLFGGGKFSDLLIKSEKRLIFLEPGIFHTQKTAVPYLIGGIFKKGIYDRWSIGVGIDTGVHLTSSLNYVCNFVTMPLDMFSPFTRWSMIGSYPTYNYNIKFFGSTNIKYFNFNNENRLFKNISLGLAYETENNRLLERVYFEYGLAFTSKDNFSFNKNKYWNFGIVFNF